jgi:hypothetical protein
MFRIGAVILLSLIFSFAFAQKDFQQKVSYVINVTLDDVNHYLHGNISIEYVNNSPHELREIYIHLWPNAYKDLNTALAKQLLENGKTNFYFSAPEERGFIDSLDFVVDNREVKWDFHAEHIDIGIIKLTKPLLPDSKITVSTPFRVKIPSSKFSRLGHHGQSYQITQWYPKPAVYDKNGWHPMPYLDQGEFYSEFGSFEVNITLPENYLVAATGVLQNDDERQKLINKARETAEIKFFERENTFPPSSSNIKRLRYIQDNVHDFAWFADKRFHVLKGEIFFEDTDQLIETWAFFTNTDAHLWKKSIEYINDGIKYYSQWVGTYPYAHATAVSAPISAGGGMEYPMVTVISTVHNDYLLENVIVHEIGHNWFYGILGNNERKHPWMDEGINSFYEHRYFYTKYPGKGMGEQIIGNLGFLGKNAGLDKVTSLDLAKTLYLITARQRTDQPINLHSEEFTSLNYGAIVYSKAALAFEYLKNYLEEGVFDAAMHSYYNQWRFRHPSPDDLRLVFETQTNKNLSWFFDELIGTDKYLDYKILSVKEKERSILIKIKNKGAIAGPLSVGAQNKNGFWTYLWVDGFEGIKEFELPKDDYKLIKIDFENVMPELNSKNNNYRPGALFKKFEPLDFKFLGAVENPEKTQIFFTPVVGYNRYDEIMPGIAFYNFLIPRRNFEYILVPMYGIGSGRLVGTGNMQYNFYSASGFFHAFRPAVNYYSFSYSNHPLDLFFRKITPQLTIDLKKNNPRSAVNQSIRLRSVNIFQEDVRWSFEDREYVTVENNLIYNDVQYNVARKHNFNPWFVNITFEQGDEYLKSFVEAKYAFSYKNKTHGVDLRLFFGGFLINENSGRAQFKMSGWDGRQDYLYDHVFIGRTDADGKYARQMVEEDGGFKVYTPIGRSDKWLTAVNLKIALPFLPVRIFADAGTYSGAKDAFSYSETLMYDAGLMIAIIPNVSEIYFPFFTSDDIRRVHELNNPGFDEKNAFKKMFDQVRFMIRFKEMNPFNLFRSIGK